jgi:hypothetical protein
VPEVRLVDLDDVGAGLEERMDLLVDGNGEVERERPAVAVVEVLRLLGHGERPGQRDLDLPVGVLTQERDVTHLDGPPPAHRAADGRHPSLRTRAVDRGTGVVDVHAVEGGGEPVRVAFPADLAVGDDVDAGELEVADREPCGVVLGLLEMLRRDAPDLTGAGAWGQPPAEHRAVDEPVGLRVAADDGRGQKLMHGDASPRDQRLTAVRLRCDSIAPAIV